MLWLGLVAIIVLFVASRLGDRRFRLGSRRLPITSAILESAAQNEPERPVHTTVKNEYSWGVINWLAGAEVGNSSELSLAMMTLSAGCATDTHLHDNCEEAVYVISGTIDCAADGSNHQLTAGDHVIVRRGAIHQLRNPGTQPAKLILSYSSAVRDFTLAEEPGNAS